MQEFYIYYRGQNINQVKAKDAKAALAEHFKEFSQGAYQSVAMPIASSMEAFELARQQSQALRAK